MSKPTPLPWRSEPNGPCFNLLSPDRAKHHCILVGMNDNANGELKANAEFIVRAVNAHEDLLAALEAVAHWIKIDPKESTLATMVESAIAKATS